MRDASARYTSYANQVLLPGYAEANVMAYYQGGRYRMQVNVNNITDQSWYASADGDNEIMPGTPRNVMASLSVDF